MVIQPLFTLLLSFDRLQPCLFFHVNQQHTSMALLLIQFFKHIVITISNIRLSASCLTWEYPGMILSIQE